jgi:hypothetical protein
MFAAAVSQGVCGIIGIVLHALSGDVDCMPFSDMALSSERFHHAVTLA